MPDIEERIREWRRQMLAAGIKTPVPLQELECHLRDDLERRLHQGLNPQQAFEVAVERLGSGKELQPEFAKGRGALSHRRIYSAVLAALAVYFAGASCLFAWISHISATVGPLELPRTPEWLLPWHAMLGLAYALTIMVTLFARRRELQSGKRLNRILNWALLPVLPFGPFIGIYGMWLEKMEARRQHPITL